MRITTSLIAPRRDTAWIAALFLAAGALLLLVLTVWIAVATVELRVRETDLETRVTALKNADSGDIATRRDAARDLSSVRDRVQRLNELVGHNGRPTLSLLATLERLLPGPAALVSLQHRVETGDVVLIVAAADSVPLTAFLRALEREPRFQQVLLLHQATAKTGNNTQFEIRLKERA